MLSWCGVVSVFCSFFFVSVASLSVSFFRVCYILVCCPILWFCKGEWGSAPTVGERQPTVGVWAGRMAYRCIPVGARVDPLMLSHVMPTDIGNSRTVVKKDAVLLGLPLFRVLVSLFVDGESERVR